MKPPGGSVAENLLPVEPSQGYDPAKLANRVSELFRAGTLLRGDADVLHRLLALRRESEDSTWTTKDVLARDFGCSARTVKRSFKRLETAGLIAQVELGNSPDPDDPTNRTGWRIYFPFVPGCRHTASTVDRRPNASRQKWIRTPVASQAAPSEGGRL